MLEGGERVMRGVRLRILQHLEPPRVEVPDLDRVAPERVDGRILPRVVLGPHPARRAEVGNAALGAHTSPGQDDARLVVADQSGKQIDGHADYCGHSNSCSDGVTRGNACRATSLTKKDEAVSLSIFE